MDILTLTLWLSDFWTWCIFSHEMVQRVCRGSVALAPVAIMHILSLRAQGSTDNAPDPAAMSCVSRLGEFCCEHAYALLHIPKSSSEKTTFLLDYCQCVLLSHAGATAAKVVIIPGMPQRPLAAVHHRMTPCCRVNHAWLRHEFGLNTCDHICTCTLTHSFVAWCHLICPPS